MQAGITTSPRLALMAILLFASCDRHQSIARQQLQRVRVSQFHMGMMVHLTLWAPTIEKGRQAAATAFERIGLIDQIMSDYEPESELNRLCRQSGQGPVPVSHELFTVLAAARRLAEWTEGRYDPTVGPLTRLWRKARQANVPPSQVAIATALEQVGYEKLLLDADAQTAELTQPGMWIDLGSIAKGYAGDQAIKSLREQGISRAAYEAGGDKVFGAAPPGTESSAESSRKAGGWQVELDSAMPKLPPLANCAVSISSDAAQFFEYDGRFSERAGRRIGHVIDPRTGSGFRPRATCVVVALRGIDSDPLATIGTMMPPASYQSFLKQRFPAAVATISENSYDVGTNGPRIPPP